MDNPKTELSAHLIQSKFALEFFHNYEIIAFNHVPISWRECDIWAMSKSLYFTEFEIKLSVADFHNDFKKTMRKHWDYDKKDYITETKHDLLSGRVTIEDMVVPNRFCFILPEDMPVTTPDYSGEIRVVNRNKGILLRWVKKPPLINKNKVSINSVIDVARSLSHRYLLHRRDEVRQKPIYEQ